jgi:hypothetical protein
MRNLRRPSPALVISIVAIFVALGGTGYAAIKITGKQIKDSSLTGKDVKNRSLTKKDFKGSVTGPRGAQGAQGGTGPTGPAGPFTDTLPSGKTLRGVYLIQGRSTAAGASYGDAVSFAFTLSSSPTAHVVPFVGPRPPGCPGTDSDPQASPGHLCVYETDRANATPPDLSTSRPRFGFEYTVDTPTTATAFYAKGSWAVTAP